MYDYHSLKKKIRGQVGLEYIMVFGFALMIIIPFTFYFFYYTEGPKQQTDMSQASLLEASHFIGTLEVRQGVKISCPEEIAYRKKFIDVSQFERLIAETPASSYRTYLELVLREQF